MELFLQPLVKFFSIGDFAVELYLGNFAVHVGIDVDPQLLALLNKQQLIDLIA